MSKQKTSQEIEEFLKAIDESFKDFSVRPNWPYNAAQIDAYFDAIEASDMFQRIKKLRVDHSTSEIAKILPHPDALRFFLTHNGIVGLKVADKLDFAKISSKERVEFCLFIFEVIRHKVQSDPFCLKHKNLILSNEELKKVQDSDWLEPQNDQEKKDLGYLVVTSNNLCYTLFYDVFITSGAYFHGPYDVTEKFGENCSLVVREYVDICPSDLWPGLKKMMPFKKLTVYAVYKNSDYSLNFINQPMTKTSLPDKLVAYKILLDGHEKAISGMNEFVETITQVSASQVKKINAMPDLDKIKKGAEITYYTFRRLREFMGDDWKPPKMVYDDIDFLGDKFIRKFGERRKMPLKHWRMLYDPRYDEFE